MSTDVSYHKGLISIDVFESELTLAQALKLRERFEKKFDKAVAKAKEWAKKNK